MINNISSNDDLYRELEVFIKLNKRLPTISLKDNRTNDNKEVSLFMNVQKELTRCKELNTSFAISPPSGSYIGHANIDKPKTVLGLVLTTLDVLYSSEQKMEFLLGSPV